MIKENNSSCPKTITKRSHVPSSKAGIEAASETLQHLIASKNTMLFRSSATWWSKNGDKMNKYFFIYKNPRTNRSYKPKLIKEDGLMSEDVSEILEAVTSDTLS